MLAAIGRRFRPSPPLSSLINIFAWDWDVDVTRRRRRVVVVLAAAGWQCFEVGAGRGTEHDRTPGSKHEGHTGTSDFAPRFCSEHQNNVIPLWGPGCCCFGGAWRT